MNDRNPHDPCLRVEAATFMIGSTTLLHDIDFTAHGGELVALVGPNGAGKSTFSRSWRATSSPLAAGYSLMVGLSRTGRLVSSHSGAQS